MDKTISMNKWESEPDYLEFIYKGFKCFIKRNHFQALCGYVVVPEGNTLYLKNHTDINIDCHGGLTYSEKEVNNWVIGFDCAHYDDFCPGLIKYSSTYDEETYEETYKDMNYVTNELHGIVDQLILTQEDHRGMITSSLWAT